MDFKILILVVTLCCAGSKSEKELDMLVRLDPLVCPEFTWKCRQSCTRLNYQIGFCNSNHQCVCVKESSVEASKDESSTRTAKDDFFEGQVTFFLSRMLRLGVSSEELFRSIKSNPLFRKMKRERMVSHEWESQSLENEVDSQNEKKITPQNRTLHLRTEIVPIFIFRDDVAPESEWGAEKYKNSRLGKGRAVSQKKRGKIISGTLELHKVHKLLKSGSSHIKFTGKDGESQKKKDYDSEAENDANKVKVDNVQSIDTVGILLVPALRDDIKTEKRGSGSVLPVKTASPSLEILKKRFLSLLPKRTRNIASEKTADSKKIIFVPEKSGQVIGNTMPVLREETKTTGKREVTQLESERPVKKESKIKAPECLKIKDSERFKIKEPEMPKVEEPKSPKIKEPEMLRVEEPKSPKIKETEMPKAEEPKSPKIKEPEMLIVEEPKSPKIKEPEMPRIEEPKSPKIKDPEMPRIEEPKSPKIKDPEMPRVEEPKSPKMKEPEMPKVEEPKSLKIKEPESLKQGEYENPKIKGVVPKIVESSSAYNPSPPKMQNTMSESANIPKMSENKPISSTERLGIRDRREIPQTLEDSSESYEESNESFERSIEDENYSKNF